MSVPAIFRSWVWALFWLSVIALLLVSVLDKAQVDWRKTLLDEYWRKVYLSEPQERPNIVVIGDSLVGRSFPLSRDEPGFMGEENVWANVWIGGASFKDFTGFFGGKGQQYDLVIINLSTLANDASRRGKRPLSNYPDMVKKDLLLYPIKSNFDQFYEKARGYCGSRDQEQTVKIIGRLKQQYRPDKPTDQELAEFLKSISTVAKKVVVLELPRAEPLTKKINASLIGFRQHVSSMVQEENIEFVRISDSMPSDHYCDGSHPNDVGREIRRVQLRNLVMERLASTL